MTTQVIVATATPELVASAAPPARTMPGSIVEVTPFLTAACEQADFQTAYEMGFQNIYMPNGSGKWLMYKKLAGKLANGEDRSICVTIDKLPANVKFTAAAVQVPLGIRFLPDGKVPKRIMNQVLAFFKAVMTKFKSDDEAMCHILWNPTMGYFMAVPKQRVSKASVSFESDHIDPSRGDIVVLDIHSHNTMGAFFSGTDDTNDRTNVCISGVFGKLDKKEFETKWRLNIAEYKIELKLDDVFSTEEEAADIPGEWLDAVEKTTYATSVKGGGYRGGVYGHGLDNDDDTGFGAHNRSFGHNKRGFGFPKAQPQTAAEINAANAAARGNFSGSGVGSVGRAGVEDPMNEAFDEVNNDAKALIKSIEGGDEELISALISELLEATPAQKSLLMNSV